MLAKDGYAVLFDPEGCSISKDAQDVIRATGTGLYTLQTNGLRSTETALKAEAARKETASMWHRRLGHLNIARVTSLEKIVKGILLKQENAN